MQQIGEFDYVIVGAGSAGCVLAARLSENGKYRVALLEAGGEANSFWFKSPLAFGMLSMGTKFTWGHVSEPEQELGDVRVNLPRGKVIGGTGSINGMVYLRGQREDFDLWRQLGNVGWSYEDVLPYFKKSENNEWGESIYHGGGGPLRITTLPIHELGHAFVAAGEQAGYPRNRDFNSPVQEGFGHAQVNISNGQRVSTADAFLTPARARKNLAVITIALVSRVLLEKGRAVGVEFKRAGITERILARREVIVATGTYNSPQLLQLSGIGPAQLLRDHSIPIQVDLPGVGEDLQDHFNFNMTYRCTRKITINDTVTNPFRRYLMGLNYLLFRKGFMATNGHAAQGFVKSDSALAAPDLLVRLRLFSRNKGTKSWGNLGLVPYPSFDAGVQLMHADSRGTIRIKNSDVTTHPAIKLNSFSAERDQKATIAGFRIMRKLMSMPALQPYIAGEVTSASSCKTDEEILEFCRQYGSTMLHPTSTCRMGVDEMAVVDPRLRVRGVTNLRVADASVMPRCVGANTNATTIMIAEKGAAMILEDARV